MQIDEKNISIGGFSAGGMLSAVMSLRAAASRLPLKGVSILDHTAPDRLHDQFIGDTRCAVAGPYCRRLEIPKLA